MGTDDSGGPAPGWARAPDRAPLDPPATDASSTEGSSAGRPHPRRVLVVEDDPASAHLIELAIGATGPSVATEVVADGAAALDRLRRGPGIDVMLLDLNMPGVNGFDVLAALRRGDAPSPRTIVLTASSDPRDRARCAELGADAFHTKPSRFSDLCDLLAVELDGEPFPDEGWSPDPGHDA